MGGERRQNSAHTSPQLSQPLALPTPCGPVADSQQVAPSPGVHTLCDPSPLRVGGACDLLPANRTQERWWNECDYIMFRLFSHPAGVSVMAGFKGARSHVGELHTTDLCGCPGGAKGDLQQGAGKKLWPSVL